MGTPVHHTTGTVPNLNATLERRVSQDSSTVSKVFRISGQISSIPGTLPLRSFLNYLSDLCQGVNPQKDDSKTLGKLKVHLIKTSLVHISLSTGSGIQRVEFRTNSNKKNTVK